MARQAAPLGIDARQEPREQAHRRQEGAGAIDELDAGAVGQFAEQRRREAAEAEAKRLADAEAARQAEAARPKPAPVEPPTRSETTRAAEQAKRDEIRARGAARLAQAEAEDAERRASVKPAALGRVRSDYGATATLQQVWTFRNLDRAKLDKRAIWAFISDEALEQAVQRFIDAGHRELKGVEIFQTTRSQTR